MKVGQTLESHQTPIATDTDAAALFCFGLDSTIKASNEASGKETPNIGRSIQPRKGVWGQGFCKP